jgi:hypothetical protein
MARRSPVPDGHPRIHHHQAASNRTDYMGPLVRPCRRPQLQKPRTSRARRVLALQLRMLRWRTAAWRRLVGRGSKANPAYSSPDRNWSVVAGNRLRPPVLLLLRQHPLTARQGRNARGPWTEISATQLSLLRPELICHCSVVSTNVGEGTTIKKSRIAVAVSARGRACARKVEEGSSAWSSWIQKDQPELEDELAGSSMAAQRTGRGWGYFLPCSTNLQYVHIRASSRMGDH